MMKKITFLFIVSLLAIFSSCNSEDDFLNSFPTLDNVQYSYYVAEALDAMNMPRPEGSYNYPCLPGMPKWKELKISEEMNRVLRIPKKILKNQSTQAVIQAMWEHPDFPVLIVSSSNSSIQYSLDKVLHNWDIYHELIKRPDAASCLVERYGRMNLTKSVHDLYLNSLQLLLSQTFFLDQLSLDDKVQLAKTMSDRIEEVRKLLNIDNDAINALSIQSFYFCIARIMSNSEYAPMLAWMEEDKLAQEYEDSGDEAYLMADSFRMKLLELSTNFINGN